MDLAAKKQAFASQMVALADELLLVGDKLDDLSAGYAVNGFLSGGAHAFVDGDFTTGNVQLNATIVADAMYVINLLQAYFDSGKRNSLREALSSGLP